MSSEFQDDTHQDHDHGADQEQHAQGVDGSIDASTSGASVGDGAYDIELIADAPSPGQDKLTRSAPDHATEELLTPPPKTDGDVAPSSNAFSSWTDGELPAADASSKPGASTPEASTDGAIADDTSPAPDAVEGPSDSDTLAAIEATTPQTEAPSFAETSEVSEQLAAQIATEIEHGSLRDPAYYINRELSWLEFNQRVLEQARDESIPLLERVKFLCICSSNLDEFFEVRVARLMQQVHMEAPRTGPDKLTPKEQLDRILKVAQDFVAQQYKILNEELFPQLADEGVVFYRRTEWTPRQAKWVANYFRDEVMPILSPIGLDPAHPFPRILNKSLNFIVSLSGEDAFGRASGIAVVQAPRSLPRLIPVPEEIADGPNNFVFLSSIIHAHVAELFAGMTVRGCYQFRVTRNAELFVDEEEIEDLMLALEDELFGRHFGDAVRLEVADNCPMEVANFLLHQFELDEANLFQVNGPVNLNRLMMVPGAVDRPDLKYPPYVPDILLGGERTKTDIFRHLREEGDILLHHPFQSFSTVIDFVRQASQDPNVLAIKQTLYRTVPDSPLVEALADAARSGKEVTTVIELRARFDEERNIQIAGQLQEAGAHVVYGVVGYKTHAKMLLIVRRELDGLKRYVHLGTGNYHPRTTKLYTDFGYMTANPELGEDVHKVFQQLTGLGTMASLKQALQAPFSLHSKLLELIEVEIEHARAGKRAHIMAKMNSLTEVEVTRALYRASRAGVQIDLIIRGICRLRPGIPGLSENIRVRSIVGRFLEHTRTYYFYNGGNEVVLCGSADWMSRNLLRRVEVAFPVLDPILKNRVINESFDIYLADNQRAWTLEPDGSYTRVAPGPGQEPVSAQEVLLEQLAEE